ncbi:phage lytic cycle repressor MrpR family protein [Paenibacillus odorifer]|uniref:phage lytic cycle repressor MrpR family protein n=1 Tax=Paenibacillus odorifer TaxID=189426 RepID=UPI00096F992B|nr:hypothetical protein [Paenibacillus odorifer]OMD66777.1 hypothetical protein BSK50_30645 [Paenibacillus odorifer]
MSNKIYDNELYNKEQKERYLKGFPINTYGVNKRVLKRASYIEEQLNKDLYDFNLREIEQLLSFLAPKTMTSCHSSVVAIQSYIRWAIQEDLRKDNINPLDAVMGESYYMKFVDTSIKSLFTDIEIERITDRLVNSQDSAIIQCLFEGIKGTGYSEILNILKSDLSRESNIIELRDELNSGSMVRRKIEISDNLMDMLFDAANETTYQKNNGDSMAKAPESELVENEYVFRSSILNIKEYGRASSHLILRRLKAISKLAGQPQLTATNIQKSGMIKFGYDLYKERGVFDTEEIREVCSRFDIKINSSFRVRRDFLNINTIKSVYNEE